MMEDKTCIMEDRARQTSTPNQSSGEDSTSRLQEDYSQSSPYSNTLDVRRTQDDDLLNTQPNVIEDDASLDDDYEGSPTQLDIVPPFLDTPMDPDSAFEDDYEGSPTQPNAFPTFLESQNPRGVPSPDDHFTIPTQLIPNLSRELKSSFTMKGLPSKTQLANEDIDSSVVDSARVRSAPNPSITTHFNSSKSYNPHSTSQHESPWISKDATSRLQASIGLLSTRDGQQATVPDLVANVLMSRDEDLPRTQEVSHATSSQSLPVEGSATTSRDTLIVQTDSSISTNNSAVDSQEEIAGDGDLSVTQAGSSTTTKAQHSSFNSCISHEDTQPTPENLTNSSSSSQRPIGSLPSLKEMRSKPSVFPSTILEGTESTADSPKPESSGLLASTEKLPLNKLSCRERKRIATSYNRPPALTKAMTLWITKTHNLLDPFREDDDCWFHPSPPPARPTVNGALRPCGKLQKCFTWQDRRGKHSLVLNYGIVSKIINYKLTKQQKDGFINKQWHLSHLCGNWTCLNPEHTIVEPGKVNISRNNCFSHRSGCPHDPKCLKDKKVLLSPNGFPVYQNVGKGATNRKATGSWDDWSMQSFDDGEVSVMLDDQDEMEFALQVEDEDEDEEASLEAEAGHEH
jgi:hypothetical protein